MAAAEVEVMVVDDKGGDNVDLLGVGVNISFTHDLADRLEPLKRILPVYLAAPIPLLPTSLSPSTAVTTSDSATTPTPTVPYSLLYSISKWTRTEEGAAALAADSLNPRSYEMVSLLAGSTTSPDRKFPPHKAEINDPLADTRREIDDRRTVVTLINALLSIGGSGTATWYATGAAGWQNEWRALFSLTLALLVAIAEGVLFVLWNSRRSKAKGNRGRLLRNPRTQGVDVKIKVE
ncbi:hypothetical protein BDM02DRAFT_3114750 [Thelephora ganbajun]|uniref:Uncharacterized protein n=1 Tax=Thelephora ganbajun TaxID=370292 RepID=A0ACB6ZHG4_THEGA|nr:hypothetical protein BDM02DRAFT_3114750 [Thelephora ganbajun]